jgi:hypothetical protein
MVVFVVVEAQHAEAFDSHERLTGTGRCNHERPLGS